MLKKHRRITNYYCPRSPKRFTILDQSVLRREWTSTEPASEDHNDNLSEINGIIDSWKVNKRFANLVVGLGITQKDASEAADNIMDWQPRRGLVKGLDDNIIRDSSRSSSAKETMKLLSIIQMNFVEGRRCRLLAFGVAQ